MNLPARKTAAPAVTAVEVYTKLHQRELKEAIETASLEFMDEADARRQACPMAHRAIDGFFDRQTWPAGILAGEWARGILGQLNVWVELPSGTDPVMFLDELRVLAQNWTALNRPGHCPFCGVSQKRRYRAARRV